MAAKRHRTREHEPAGRAWTSHSFGCQSPTASWPRSKARLRLVGRKGPCLAVYAGPRFAKMPGQGPPLSLAAPPSL